MKHTTTATSRLVGLATIISLATPAWADVVPISDPGGPYGVLSTASLSLDGSGSLPSDGQSITLYEWDLDNDGDFDEAITGATPAAIPYATLTGTYGMTSGPNTIKLRVTDDAPLSTTAEATVYLDGTVYIGPNTTGSQNTWNSAGNWDSGSVPSGTVDVIIPDGKYVVPWDDATPTYTGDLYMGTNSTIQVGWTTNRPNSYNCLGTSGSTTITMADGAYVKGRTNATFNVPAIVLEGDVLFQCGESTQTPGSPQFVNPITGAHEFAIVSNASGPTVTLGAANTFSGLVIRGINGRGGAHGTVKATAAGSLGNGSITIESTATNNGTLKLEFDIVGASTAANTLNINGGGPAGDGANRIQMDADNTVGFLNVGGFPYPAGTYGRVGSPGTPTYEMNWIAGDAILTVTGAPADIDPPVVTSITDTVSPFTTNLYVGGTVTFTLTFDEPVNSSVTTADFENAAVTTPATVTIDNVTQTDVNVFTVVATVTGTGNFTLGAKASASFDDLFGNTLNGPFTDDTTFTVLAGSPPTLTISGTAGGSDSWNTGANWDSGFPPFGSYPAVIADGVTAQASNAATATYSGGLTIGAGSELDIKNVSGSEKAIGTGPVTFNAGSTLRLRSGYTLTIPGNINLAGNAQIFNSDNSTDNRTRDLTGDISGAGQLTVSVRRGNTLNLTGTNTWSGGFVFNYIDNNFSNGSKVVPGNSGLGTGDVTINDGLQLWLTGTTDAIGDSAALYLNGRGRNNSANDRKLRLDSNETVGELWLDNTTGDGTSSVQLAAGDYTSASGLLDSAGLPLITGSGTLTVLSGPGGGTPYENWAGGSLFGDDDNGDGISNGLAFLLGAADPDADALALLPTVTETSGGLVMTFDMLDSASRGTATLYVEHSSDLGISDAWTQVAVPDSSGGPTDGVTFVVSGSGTLDVTATIDSLEAAGGKLFGRLKATE